MNGIIVVNKKSNLTSRDVVNIANKKLNTKKIGHTGTLDPLAEGVLVLTVNKATKISELLTNYEKEYIAEVILGIKTDTLDITGKIIQKENIKVTKKQVINALNQMIGSYNQEVPIYSAVKIKGHKLYEYARNNEDVTLPKREVIIKKLELISEITYIDQNPTFKIRCLVSKGTYIRSLINDIALKLNTIGIMKSLIRTKQGDFSLKQAIDIDNISYDKIISLKDCLNNYYQVEINNELYNKIKNGQKLDNIYNQEIVVFIYNKEVIAIYKKHQDNLLKPWKMFI